VWLLFERSYRRNGAATWAYRSNSCFAARNRTRSVKEEAGLCTLEP
jgi:hypothetical protein